MAEHKRGVKRCEACADGLPCVEHASGLAFIPEDDVPAARRIDTRRMRDERRVPLRLKGDA